MSHASKLFALSCLVIFVAGCASSTPVRYYSLEASDVVSRPGRDQAPIVGLGPLDLPGYLSRPQIVTRSNDAEMKVDDFNRWAEPLDQSIHRVVAANVESLVEQAVIVAFPYSAFVRPDYRVHGSVSRFDADRNGNAVLIVQWGIATSEREAVGPPQRSRYESVASNPDDVGAVVKALNDTLAEFSVDIADQLKSTMD